MVWRANKIVNYFFREKHPCPDEGKLIIYPSHLILTFAH